MIYGSVIQPVLVYGAETGAVRGNWELLLIRAEVRMIRWMMNISRSGNEKQMKSNWHNHTTLCNWSICRKHSPITHKEKKGKFLYSAVSGPQDCSKRFYTLLPWQTCSIKHSNSLGSIQPYATNIARRLLIYTSTTVYSQVLIYTAE